MDRLNPNSTASPTTGDSVEFFRSTALRAVPAFSFSPFLSCRPCLATLNPYKPKPTQRVGLRCPWLFETITDTADSLDQVCLFFKLFAQRANMDVDGAF